MCSVRQGEQNNKAPSFTTTLSHLCGVDGRIYEEVKYLLIVDLHVGDGHAKCGFDSSVDFLKHVRQRSRGYAAVLQFPSGDDPKRAGRGDSRKLHE